MPSQPNPSGALQSEECRERWTSLPEQVLGDVVMEEERTLHHGNCFLMMPRRISVSCTGIVTETIAIASNRSMAAAIQSVVHRLSATGHGKAFQSASLPVDAGTGVFDFAAAAAASLASFCFFCLKESMTFSRRFGSTAAGSLM